MDSDHRTILLLATNPQAPVPLLEQELQSIAAGFEKLPQQQQFNLERRSATRPRELQRAILDVEPRIIHFSGWRLQLPSLPNDLQQMKEKRLPDLPLSKNLAGSQGLLFADEAGNAQPISGDALAALFSLFAEGIQCVVLSGCYLEGQARAIAQQIPYVIGISQEMGRAAAIEFSTVFYETLASGRPIEFAYKLAASTVQMSGIPAQLTPVLLQKASGSGEPAPVLEPSPANPPASGNMFNISGSNITNMVGSGSITYNEATKQEQPSSHVIAGSLPISPEAPSPSPPPAASATPAAANVQKRQIKVFFSYSHRDEDLRDEMAKHLSILKRQGVISEWHDRDIGAGMEWAQEIDAHLNSAQVILLLISPDFIASDYCFDIEMGRAMERHEAGEACVIPVILRPVDWSGAPFSKLQAFPKNAQPVTSWANRDEAFLNVTQGIRKAVERLAAR